jgi:ketosteroid isomerase-like protein
MRIENTLDKLVAAVLILLSLCLAFVAADSGFGAGQRQREQADRAALERAVAQWDARFNAGDVAGLSALYVEDVVSMPFDAPAVRGRAAVAADFAKFFSQNGSIKHTTIVEDFIISGDLAVERSSYELRYRPKTGGVEFIETGKHVEIRRRINGEWLIVTEIWNMDGPSVRKVIENPAKPTE